MPLRWPFLPLFLCLHLLQTTQAPCAGPPLRPAPGSILRVANWENYFGSQTLRGFEETTGVHVQLTEYLDEEEAFARLMTGEPYADVLVLTRGLVGELVKARRLETIDWDRLPNTRFIDDAHRPAPDGAQRHYTPYLTGTTGVVVNTRLAPTFSSSWDLLWDARFAGRLAMLNNPFEVIGAASKRLGMPLNPRSQSDLDTILRSLVEQRPLLIGYLDPMTLVDQLATGRLVAAQLYSGDALTAAARNPDLYYFVPKEGAALWVDVLVIPRPCANKEAALAFINHVHTPEVMAAICRETRFASVNQAANALLEPEILQHAGMPPPAEALERSEFFVVPGNASLVHLINETWSDLMVREP